MEIDKQERMRRAEGLFMQGFNCSQAVVAAFADVYGMPQAEALRVSAGSATPGDRQGKSGCYKVVQQLAEEFRREHGSIICSELLQLKKGAPLDYEASERTAEYYKARPCVRQVISAARIYSEYLEGKQGQGREPQVQQD